MGAACARQEGDLLLYSVLRSSQYSPQAALLMLECDRSLATHRYTPTGAQNGDDSDSGSGSDEEEDVVSPMTALISGSNDWILSTCLSIVRLLPDPSCLLRTDSANRTRCFCCAW
jgi:hypothetical protein